MRTSKAPASIRLCLMNSKRSAAQAPSHGWIVKAWRNIGAASMCLRSARPYPVSMTFDSANPSETCPRRESSNTPLQALTLLNNPTFFESTQGLARRMLLSNARTPEERIARGFELCLARKPSRPELSRLTRLFEDGQRLAATDRRQVAAIMGNFEMDARDLDDAAGFVLVAQVIMNLEEFLTRE